MEWNFMFDIVFEVFTKTEIITKKLVVPFVDYPGSLKVNSNSACSAEANYNRLSTDRTPETGGTGGHCYW